MSAYDETGTSGKTVGLKHLVARSFLYHFFSLALSLIFTLTAPNYMGDVYPEYVFFVNIIQWFILYLTIGSAGVFNRFVHETDYSGIRSLFQYALLIKFIFFLPLFICVGAFSVKESSSVFVFLAVIAFILSGFEAIFLLMYSLEQYEIKFHTPVVSSAAKLLFLPLHGVSLLLYICFVEFFKCVTILKSVFSVYSLKQFRKLFLPQSQWRKRLPEKKLLKNVTFDTYLLNLLFYSMPLFPMFMIKSFAADGLRDMTIMYVISINI